MRGASIFLALACLRCAASLEGTSASMPTFEDHERVGFYRLLFDEFQSFNPDTLSRSALARKVHAAALIGWEHAQGRPVDATRAGYARLLERRYGFVNASRVANAPESGPSPSFDAPMGLVTGTIENELLGFELEVSNNGCASCHAANLYDQMGQPTREVWVGLPSSSVNFGRFADESFAALLRAFENKAELLALLREIFPTVSEREIETIEEHYLPALDERIHELDRNLGSFTPYSNGSPGLTNGVATIQFYLGAIDDQAPDPSQVAFSAIPEFGGLRFKRSILADGVYAPKGRPHSGRLEASGQAHRAAMAKLATLVTVGTLGVEPEIAVTNADRMGDVIDELFDHYEPPPFPGLIDETLAQRGEALYVARCESCHGSFEERDGRMVLVDFPNRIVPVDTIGTDPIRSRAVTGDAQELFDSTALGAILDAASTGGYVAPPLTGVWATAPYLHNGSVPTLWSLMTPEERPGRFWVGGHALDYGRGGLDLVEDDDGVFRYPPDYAPWSLPEVYDVEAPGHGNAGHERQFVALSAADKRALLEFMKRL